TEVLYGASFTDANTGTVVGQSGTILRMSTTTGIEDNTIKIPTDFVLMQNYPNPFNPTTQIRFGIPEAGSVTLKIYNSVGQLVKTFVDGNMSEGYHQVTWDATDDSGNKLSSGVYFYRITAGTFNQVNKMLLMK
ncbi:MAG: FlgD immunoglobulin-like domain containing protein, partial [Ignavibacteriaceae bacterium]